MVGASINFSFLSELSVKRECRCRPTENRFSDRTPLLLCRYFTDNNARFVSSRILNRKVYIAVHFDFHSNDATSQSEPIILDPGAF